MTQTDEPKIDPSQRFEDDFKRQFRPDHSRAGRTTPRTLDQLDAIPDGDAE